MTIPNRSTRLLLPEGYALAASMASGLTILQQMKRAPREVREGPPWLVYHLCSGTVLATAHRADAAIDAMAAIAAHATWYARTPRTLTGLERDRILKALAVIPRAHAARALLGLPRKVAA